MLPWCPVPYLTSAPLVAALLRRQDGAVLLVQDDAPGLSLCGEGAGWAGGIVSGPIDGIESARAALDACSPTSA